MIDKGIYYNADYFGAITLKDGLSEDDIELITTEVSKITYNYEFLTVGDWNTCLDFAGEGYYSHSNWVKFLCNIKPFVSDGFVNLRGDDDSFWRFHFVTDNWYEERGSIVYDDTRAILIENERSK